MPSAADSGLGDGGEMPALLAPSHLHLRFQIVAVPDFLVVFKLPL